MPLLASGSCGRHSAPHWSSRSSGHHVNDTVRLQLQARSAVPDCVVLLRQRFRLARLRPWATPRWRKARGPATSKWQPYCTDRHELGATTSEARALPLPLWHNRDDAEPQDSQPQCSNLDAMPINEHLRHHTAILTRYRSRDDHNTRSAHAHAW